MKTFVLIAAANAFISGNVFAANITCPNTSEALALIKMYVANPNKQSN